MAYDLAVIGAGPAGLGAAVTAAEAGLSVALVDAAERPGGQYFRHVPESFHAARPGALHHGWPEFARLKGAVAANGRIDHLAGHRVWTVEGHGEGRGPFVVHALVGEREGIRRAIEARGLVIATGAYDRSLPFPGWDLPGVLTAGGAQALLKGNLVRAGRRVVVAGTGPFLLPVAAGLAAAGAGVVGVYEANLLRQAVPLVRDLGKAIEGAGYGAAFLRHRIPFRTGHAVVAAHGDRAVEAVSVARLDREWHPVPGTERIIECDALAVGYGFTPQLEIALQLGCATRVDSDGSLVAVVDAAQRTSVRRVWAAGETTGVGGADLALTEGRLAGVAAARELGARRGVHEVGVPAVGVPAVGVPEMGVHAVGGLLRARRRSRRFAAELRRAYAIRPGWLDWLRGDTLICRCEEVSRARLAEAVEELGAADARTAKLISRAGMGWCQGRVCGYAVTCLAGAPHDPSGLVKRPIAQPIRLGELAEG